MWVKFNDWYNQVVEVPKIFGLNHILFICAAIALTIFLLFVFQSASRNVVRGAIIFVWIFIFLSELIFRQFGQIAWMKVHDGAKYNLAYVPVQIVSLYFWVLPFYFFIPNKKWEAAMLPFIGISGLTIGAILLVYPAVVFSNNTPNNVYYMFQSALTFSLGCYLILKGKLPLRSWRTYVYHIVFMVSIFIAAVILNEVVYAATSNEAVHRGINFMYLSHRVKPLPYYKDMVDLKIITDTKENARLFVTVFVLGLVILPIAPYMLFFILFRPFVKAIDDVIASSAKSEKDKASSKNENVELKKAMA